MSWKNSQLPSIPDSEPLWTKNFVKIWIFNLSICLWSFMLHAPFQFYILELGGTELLVGITAGAMSLAALSMRPLAGWILDNKSRSRLLIVSTLLITIISLLLLFIPVLAVAIILRIVGGFMFSATTTGSATNASDTIPLSRFGEGIGYLGLGNTLATALGPLIGLSIIAHLGFRPLFMAAMVVIMVAFIAATRFSYKEVKVKVRQEIHPPASKSLFSRLFNADAVPASIVVLLSAVPFGGVAVFIAIYGEITGLGNGGLYFLLIAVGTGSTRMVSGRLADRVGEKPLVLIGNVAFLFALVTLLVDSGFTFYTSGFMFGVGFGISIPAMQAMSMRIVPLEKRGSASSTFLCAHDISAGLGGFIAGVLVTAWGYKPMFAAFSVFVVASTLVYMLWASKTPSAFKVYNQAK